MTTFAVVTTCNSVGWETYGRRMVHKFVKFWPDDVPLYLYAEGFVPERKDRLRVRRLPVWFEDFKQKHRDNRNAHGLGGSRYDYRRDAVKFGHKIAALTDADAISDVLIWMDADTLTHSPVTVEWLSSLFDPECYIAWLDRNACYPECGFYMLNTRHPEHVSIMAEMRDLYVSGRVFKYGETHDSYVLQRVIEGAAKSGRIKVHSLSGPARRCAHVFINSRLGEKMDHLKGDKRKARGKSKPTDIILARPEQHWQTC